MATNETGHGVTQEYYGSPAYDRHVASMYVWCVCVCVYACMHACMYVHSFIHLFIHLLVHHRSYENYIPVDAVAVNIMFNQLCSTAFVQHHIHKYIFKPIPGTHPWN
jgi:hypothetical protein